VDAVAIVALLLLTLNDKVSTELAVTVIALIAGAWAGGKLKSGAGLTTGLLIGAFEVMRRGKGGMAVLLATSFVLAGCGQTVSDAALRAYRKLYDACTMVAQLPPPESPGEPVPGEPVPGEPVPGEPVPEPEPEPLEIPDHWPSAEMP
jgi:hypothetical protein